MTLWMMGVFLLMNLLLLQKMRKICISIRRFLDLHFSFSAGDFSSSGRQSSSDAIIKSNNIYPKDPADLSDYRQTAHILAIRFFFSNQNSAEFGLLENYYLWNGTYLFFYSPTGYPELLIKEYICLPTCKMCVLQIPVVVILSRDLLVVPFVLMKKNNLFIPHSLSFIAIRFCFQKFRIKRNCDRGCDNIWKCTCIKIIITIIINHCTNSRN
jgi:hypothetical protein